MFPLTVFDVVSRAAERKPDVSSATVIKSSLLLVVVRTSLSSDES